MTRSSEARQQVLSDGVSYAGSKIRISDPTALDVIFEHVADLLAGGWTLNLMERCTGIDRAQLNKLAHRTAAAVLESTVETLFELEPTPPVDRIGRHEELVEDWRLYEELVDELASIVEARRSEVWRARAECRGLDPAMFIAQPNGKGWDASGARRVCAQCPVWMECLLANPSPNRTGVFGGLTPTERKPQNLERAVAAQRARVAAAAASNAARLGIPHLKAVA